MVKVLSEDAAPLIAPFILRLPFSFMDLTDFERDSFASSLRFVIKDKTSIELWGPEQWVHVFQYVQLFLSMSETSLAVKAVEIVKNLVGTISLRPEFA